MRQQAAFALILCVQVHRNHGQTMLIDSNRQGLYACALEVMNAEALKISNTSGEARNPALIQIGAHLAWLNPNDPFKDMVAQNPNTHWKSVLVEPQPKIFTRLQQVRPTSKPSHADDCRECVWLRVFGCDTQRSACSNSTGS